MKALNKLTLKHMRLNMKRTVVTIIGVILSTALMLTIGTMFSSLTGTIKDDAIARNGDYHVQYRFLKENKVDELVKNVNVESYYKSHMLGYNNDTELDQSISVVEGDSKYLEKLIIKEGSLPENTSQIIVEEQFLKNQSLKVGDELKLTYGDPYTIIRDQRYDLNYANYIVDDAYSYLHMITKTYGELEINVDNLKEVSYEIVGVYRNASYYGEATTLLTRNDNIENENVVVSVKYNNPKLAEQYKKEASEKYIDNDSFGVINYNDESIMEERWNYIDPISENYQLMMFYTGFGFDNINNIAAILLTFILTILSAGCIIVIYNSFAISAIDRKREFGIYSSIGATPSQIKYSVYYEALIIGAIGMFLGVILSQAVSVFLIKIINFYTFDLVKNDPLPLVFGMHINLLLFTIPLIFMTLVIFISAMLPARKSSKTTAIDLIRQKDDIKITPKEVKTNRFVSKIFKAEGVLAHKNMKRNKKRYRITLISLVTSLVLFVSFSTFGSLLERSISYMGDSGYDIQVNTYNLDMGNGKILTGQESLDKLDPIVKDLQHISMKKTHLLTNPGPDMYSKEYREYLIEDYDIITDYTEGINLIAVSDEEFRNYTARLNISDSDYVIVNSRSVYKTVNNNLKMVEIKPFDETLSKITLLRELNDSQIPLELNNIAFTNDSEINGFNIASKFNYSTVITGEKQINKLIESDRKESNSGYYSTFGDINDSMYIKTSDSQKVVDEITDLNLDNLYAYSPTLEALLIRNVLTLARIIVYLFIAVTTLIGVTSVFNTVFTSIVLRRREFAMLRSVGMDTSGFNRILVYESILFSLKTIITGLPISFILIFTLNSIIREAYTSQEMIVPYFAILVSIFAVFIIMLSVSLYSSKNIKKENILEALRKELN